MTQAVVSDEIISPVRFIDSLLELGVTLLESGAHCGRIERNVKRVAERAGYDVDLIVTFTGISASVRRKANHLETATLDRKVKHHGAHYGIVTGTSLLTWNYFYGQVDFEEFERQLKEIKKTPKYNVWLVRFFIGVACACLCLLSKGNSIDASFAFVAAFIGLSVKQIMISKQFNIMVANLSASFVTSLISGLGVYLQWGANPQIAVATAVLYLIPGIPLINCIIDIFEGFIPIAIARGVFGAFVLLCIALGMFFSMAIFGVGNY